MVESRERAMQRGVVKAAGQVEVRVVWVPCHACQGHTYPRHGLSSFCQTVEASSVPTFVDTAQTPSGIDVGLVHERLESRGMRRGLGGQGKKDGILKHVGECLETCAGKVVRLVQGTLRQQGCGKGWCHGYSLWGCLLCALSHSHWLTAGICI